MGAELTPYPAYKDSGVEWLGELPAHWEVRRLRTIAEMRVSNVDKHSRDGERPIRLCNYVDVYKADRIRADMPLMPATAAPEEINTFRLRPGDVLITKDSEAWNDIGVPALVEGAADDTICGYHLALLRPFSGCVSGGFLFRAMQSSTVAYQFHVRANGVTRYGLTHNAIKSIWMPLPPPSEQAAIVRFLDHADRRIRRYIHAKQRLIVLLEEQEQAVIQEAVSGRIDIRTGLPYKAYKPCGVDGLRDAPEHWDVVRLSRLIRSGPKNGVSPPANEHGTLASFAISAVRNGSVDVRGTDTKTVSHDGVSVDAHNLLADDILLVRGNGNLRLVGRAGLVFRAGGFLTQRFASPVDGIEDGGSGLGPSEGFGRVPVVGLNEPADLIAQFAHAGESSSPQGTPLQLAEPSLDGIEPRGARRREVQVNARTGAQEVPNRFGRVRAAVVDDQVQGQLGRCRPIDLREELAELRGAMAPGEAAEDLAGRHVEGGVQIRGPVSLVVVRQRPAPARLHGQARLRAVERLDLRLLVDREHQRVVGRVQVEPDDVDDLLGEPGVPAELERLEPMRLDIGGPPDLPHLPLRDAGVARHQPSAPVGRFDGHPLGGQEQDALDGAPVEDGRSTGARPVHQSGESFGTVPAVPEVHGRPADVQEAGRLGGVAAPVQREQDTGSPGLTARRGRASQPPFQGVPVVREQLKALGRLHASDGTRFH